MDKKIRKILEASIHAPSGDNCQPWHLRVQDKKIELYNVPERDQSLYNLKQRAAMIAHGAFLENFQLAALSSGFKSHVELLPNPGNPNHVATIHLTEAEAETSDHCKAIPLRHTNREKYQPVKISDRQVKQWHGLTRRVGEKIWVARQKEEINRLAGLLSLNDRLVFEIPALHQFLFEQIRWSDDEARVTGDGLDIKTLGLNAVDRLFFQYLRNWRLVSVFNKTGFSGFIQMKARQLIKSSSAVAIIVVPGVESFDYIKGGELWQRLLLQLASEGLHAQPYAGLACLLQSAKEGLLDANVTLSQKSCLLSSRRELLQMIGVEDSAVILSMFRIGRGQDVTRSLRRPFDSFIIS